MSKAWNLRGASSLTYQICGEQRFHSHLLFEKTDDQRNITFHNPAEHDILLTSTLRKWQVCHLKWENVEGAVMWSRLQSCNPLSTNERVKYQIFMLRSFYYVFVSMSSVAPWPNSVLGLVLSFFVLPSFSTFGWASCSEKLHRKREFGPYRYIFLYNLQLLKQQKIIPTLQFYGSFSLTL